MSYRAHRPGTPSHGLCYGVGILGYHHRSIRELCGGLAHGAELLGGGPGTLGTEAGLPHLGRPAAEKLPPGRLFARLSDRGHRPEVWLPSISAAHRGQPVQGVQPERHLLLLR